MVASSRSLRQVSFTLIAELKLYNVKYCPWQGEVFEDFFLQDLQWNFLPLQYLFLVDQSSIYKLS